MSPKWLVIASMCFVIATASAVAGFTVPFLHSFAEAFLAALFSVFLALSIAIFILEGPELTRLGRRNKIIDRTAKSIVSDAAYANSWDTLALGRWLGSVLPEQVDVDEEINSIKGDSWEDSVNPALRKVFQLAERVRATDIESLNPIPVDDYKRTVFGKRKFTSDVRKRLGSNLDVHERLLKLSEAIDKLEQTAMQCWIPINIREVENRFRCLGQLGIASIDFHETLNSMHRRL